MVPPVAINLQRPGQATAALLGSISYAAFGAVASWDAGASGASYVRSFDLDGRIAKITSSTGNALTYDYDAGSRIKSIAESGRPTKVFAYDRDNRLTKYASGSTSILYAYDASGNRISAGDVSYNVTPTSNRLISIEWSTSGQAFSYLPSGVMTKQSGVFFLAYDARNRLVEASVGGLVTSYGVNDLGQRVTKTRGTSGASDFTAYLYDLAGHLLGTYDASGAAREEIVWLGDLPVATLQGGAAYSIMPDHLGAPHEIVNAANQRVWLWDHDPFGNGAPVAAAGFSHDLRFPGQIYDSETRLHNNGFRDYSPALGRYVETDPIGLEGGINTYAYANNNPLNAVDPTGTLVTPETYVWDIPNVVMGLVSLFDNLFHGNFASAGIDAAGLGVDVAAVVLPGVPAGAGATIAAGRGAAQGVKAGQAGAFGALKGIKGDGLTAHHIPQAAAGRTGYNEGGALVMTQAEHTLTRTYGFKGVDTLRMDAGLSFRDVLAADIRDVRSIASAT